MSWVLFGFLTVCFVSVFPSDKVGSSLSASYRLFLLTRLVPLCCGATLDGWLVGSILSDVLCGRVGSFVFVVGCLRLSVCQHCFDPCGKVGFFVSLGVFGWMAVSRKRGAFVMEIHVSHYLTAEEGVQDGNTPVTLRLPASGVVFMM